MSFKIFWVIILHNIFYASILISFYCVFKELFCLLNANFKEIKKTFFKNITGSVISFSLFFIVYFVRGGKSELLNEVPVKIFLIWIFIGFSWYLFLKKEFLNKFYKIVIIIILFNSLIYLLGFRQFLRPYYIHRTNAGNEILNHSIDQHWSGRINDFNIVEIIIVPAIYIELSIWHAINPLGSEQLIENTNPSALCARIVIV